MNKLFKPLCVITVLGLTACGSMSTTVKNHKISGNKLAGLQLDKSAAPTLLYKRTGAPSLAAYNKFIIDPIRIDYRDPKMQEISSEDIRRMQNYFYNKVSTELMDGGYTVTTRSGPETMRMSFLLSGMKAPNALPNAVGLLAPISLSVGEVTVEATFTETETNRVDAVVIDRAVGSRVLNSKPWSTWADVESAFDTWAKGIVKAVNTAHAIEKGE